jgi:hypothetical protein
MPCNLSKLTDVSEARTAIFMSKESQERNPQEAGDKQTITRVINPTLRSLHGLSDSRDRSTEGHIYNYKLLRVKVQPETESEVRDKFIRSRTRGRIVRHLVKWEEYEVPFITMPQHDYTDETDCCTRFIPSVRTFR